MSDQQVEFGGDASKLLQTISDVQTAFESLNTKILGIAGTISTYNEKFEETHRKISVFTEDGRKVTEVFSVTGKAFELLGFQIDHSKNALKEFHNFAQSLKLPLRDLLKDKNGTFVSNAELLALKDKVKSEKEINDVLVARIKLTDKIQKLEGVKTLRRDALSVKQNILGSLMIPGGPGSKSEVLNQAGILGNLVSSGKLQASQVLSIFNTVRAQGTKAFSDLSKEELTAARAAERLLLAVDKLNGAGFVSLNKLSQSARTLSKSLNSTARGTNSDAANQVRQSILGQLDLSHANAFQYMQVYRAALQATANIEKGTISPTRFNELFSSIKSGTQTFTNLTKAETQAVVGMHQLQYAISNLGPPSTNFLLSWQSIFRVFQVQLLHSFIGRIFDGVQTAQSESAKLYIKISEIQTITQKNSRTTGSWSNALHRLSDAFGIPILDAAEASYEAISNQIVNASNAFTFLEKSAGFARATVSSMADSVNLLSSVINAYGLSVADTDHITAALFKTIELGRIRASQMANTLGTSITLAKQAGISLEEYLATTATLTIKGVAPDTANTLLRNVILKLIKPTEEMNQLFHEWGVTSGQAAINTFGLVGILEKLGSALQNKGLANLAEEFPDLRALQGVVGLAGGDAAGTYKKIFEEIGGSAATAQRALEEYEKAKKIALSSPGFKFEQEKIKSANILNLTIGKLLVDEVATLTDKFGGLSKAVQTFSDLTMAILRSFTVYLPILGQFVSLLTASSNAATFLGGVIGSLSLSFIYFAAQTHFVSAINAVKVAIFGVGAAAASTSIQINGLIAAQSAAALASRAAMGVLTLGGLVNPLTGAMVVGGAVLSGFYAMYRKQQDAILTIEDETKREIEARWKDSTQKYNTEIHLRTERLKEFQKEQLANLNKDLMPSHNTVDSSLQNALSKIDPLIGKLKGTNLPTLTELLVGKPEAYNSTEKVKSAYQDLIKDLRHQVETSLDKTAKIKVEVDKQHFKNSLEGLTDTQAFEKLAKKVEELQGKSNKLFLEGKFEESRSVFEEINSLVDEMSNKKIDIFKETEASIKRSIEYLKELKADFGQRSFERKIEGLSDKAQIPLLIKRGKEARDTARKDYAAGDIDSMRKNYELADKFMDRAVDKANTLRKKHKGSYPTGNVQNELDSLYKERVKAEELIQASEKDKKAQAEKDIKGGLDSLRVKNANLQLELEENIRKTYEEQLKSKKAIYDVTMKYFEEIEKFNAGRLTAETTINKLATQVTDSRSASISAGGEVLGQTRALLSGPKYASLTRSAELAKVNPKGGRTLSEIERTQLNLLKDIESANNMYGDLIQDPKSSIYRRNTAAKGLKRSFGEYQKFIQQNPELGNEKIGNESLLEVINRLDTSHKKLITSTGDLVKAGSELEKLEREIFTNDTEELKKKSEELNKILNTLKEIGAVQKDMKPIELLPYSGSETRKQFPGYASGGMLGGPIPTGYGDNQLIYARTGEFIVNAQSAARFKSQLVAINSGISPRGYANGGTVNNTMGDINVTVSGNNSPETSVRAIAQEIRRQFRRGNVRIT